MWDHYIEIADGHAKVWEKAWRHQEDVQSEKSKGTGTEAWLYLYRKGEWRKRIKPLQDTDKGLPEELQQRMVS